MKSTKPPMGSGWNWSFAGWMLIVTGVSIEFLAGIKAGPPYAPHPFFAWFVLFGALLIVWGSMKGKFARLEARLTEIESLLRNPSGDGGPLDHRSEDDADDSRGHPS
jgi:hypothetical protein